jgi:collagenase-like PrtC family protease
MDQINFYLPDFYHRYYINLILHGLKLQYEDCFYDKVNIGAAYGCFPGSIWNGGRISLGSCKKDDITFILNEFNERGLSLRFTFTNPVLEEKHLYDTFCNLCMELGNNGMNEVLVNSPVLEAYIRKNYPKYKIISSTTKCITEVKDVKRETEKDYYLVVLDNSFNNADKLFTLENKEKYELVANSYCKDSCSRRAQHYEEVGRSQLEFTGSKFDDCSSINRDFYDLMTNRSFITSEDIFGRYYEAGFRHYKLDGRAFNQYKVVESYMYYLVKPEHRDVVRLALLRGMEKF